MINNIEHVLAIDGEYYPREECRYISNNYYKIGDIFVKDSGHCYYIEERGMFYRYDTGYVVWDYENERYVYRTSNNLIEGVVDADMQLGYFTPNLVKNCIINHSRLGTFHCLNENVALANKAVESLEDGKFYVGRDNSFERAITDLRNIRPGRNRNNYSIAFTYNLEGNPDRERLTIEYNKFNKQIDDSAIKLFNLLNPYSFGFEAETVGGFVPERYLFQNGVLPLRDGSVSGYEYTSIPYSSAKDVQSFTNFFDILSKYTFVDKMCSLHYHFGNYVSREMNQDDRLNIISLYMLYYQLQKEIWNIIPPYKKRPNFIYEKGGKDHCQDLRDIGLFNNKIYKSEANVDEKELERCFNNIFRLFNDGFPADEKCNIKSRRHIRAGQDKWNIQSRYHSLNLYNLFFSRTYTVEFRAHSATTSKDKAVAWLLICNAILKFAKQNREEIIRAKTKYNLYDVISGFRNNFGEGSTEILTEDYLNFVADYLEDYINIRKEVFLNAYFEYSDYEDLTIANDNKFEFSLKGRNIFNYGK